MCFPADFWSHLSTVMSREKKEKKKKIVRPSVSFGRLDSGFLSHRWHLWVSKRVGGANSWSSHSGPRLIRRSSWSKDYILGPLAAGLWSQESHLLLSGLWTPSPKPQIPILYLSTQNLYPWTLTPDHRALNPDTWSPNSNPRTLTPEPSFSNWVPKPKPCILDAEKLISFFYASKVGGKFEWLRINPVLCENRVSPHWLFISKSD